MFSSLVTVTSWSLSIQCGSSLGCTETRNKFCFLLGILVLPQDKVDLLLHTILPLINVWGWRTSHGKKQTIGLTEFWTAYEAHWHRPRWAGFQGGTNFTTVQYLKFVIKRQWRHVKILNIPRVLCWVYFWINAYFTTKAIFTKYSPHQHIYGHVKKWG